MGEIISCALGFLSISKSKILMKIFLILKVFGGYLALEKYDRKNVI